MCAPLASSGGVTAQVVSDNLKAGGTKACFYDPVINRSYADLAAHYDMLWCQRGNTNQRIKQKSKLRFYWLSAGFWHGCAIGTS